ncbi:MAG: flagellar biosynthesis protein FliQ [Gammaproteobacteria bacterium]|nr:flagellar biosynthesis protein FliQ [Gammaproteobacteria bacterium]MBI5615845.1 flagellar biosynthesis protein FliQ [Gammaproteobacteria bacterium]
MSPESVITVGASALEVAIELMAVLLLPALFVGLIVSVLQAATQINEMTLSFIPKLLVTVAVLVVGGPFMVRVLMDYTIRLYQSIPGFIN